jgi:hypothetical protein
MWNVKTFKTSDALSAWLRKNEERYQITINFIHNGYSVEYRKLRKM